ncbi:tail fiber assembly protein [Pantoea sp. Lij88]|uniref:tail fiber assembly protein n=1 Tax=Pantoea sp. Lij88 TaxID=3028622 RepID=UPI0024B9CCA5|nr:tail fiber assembly protein [Pantoea sp. Lij88]WHQ73405.1 tail fiber assembly protein [Pantoea sp. Lij88]
MAFGYSAKKNAFYLLDEEAAYRASGNWPDDVRPVSDDIWQKFAGTPPEGKQRVAGKEGTPVWVDLPEHEERTIEENQAVKNALLEKADTEIRMLSVVQEVYGLSDDEKQRLGAWKKHLAEVYRLNASVREKVDWPVAPVHS